MVTVCATLLFVVMLVCECYRLVMILNVWLRRGCCQCCSSGLTEKKHIGLYKHLQFVLDSPLCVVLLCVFVNKRAIVWNQIEALIGYYRRECRRRGDWKRVVRSAGVYAVLRVMCQDVMSLVLGVAVLMSRSGAIAFLATGVLVLACGSLVWVGVAVVISLVAQVYV